MRPTLISFFCELAKEAKALDRHEATASTGVVIHKSDSDEEPSDLRKLIGRASREHSRHRYFKSGLGKAPSKSPSTSIPVAKTSRAIG